MRVIVFGEAATSPNMSIQSRAASLFTCVALTVLAACEPSTSHPVDDSKNDVHPDANNSDKGPQKTENTDASSGNSAKSESPASVQPSPDSEASTDQSKNESPKTKKDETVFPGVVPDSLDAGEFPEIRSKAKRDPDPQASYEDMRKMLTASNDLGFDLLRSLAKGQKGNLAVSPISIHAAMGLLLSAATDETQAELISGNGFLDDVDRTHASLSRISMQLAALQEEKTEKMDPVNFKLANRIFVRPNATPNSEYLDVLAKYYDTGAYTVDFGEKPEPSREAINQWVSDNTESKIKDLLPKNSITSVTQWVFVNALYFKAPWSGEIFDTKSTSEADFRLKDGTTTSVPMMHGFHNRGYRGETKNFSWGAIPLGRREDVVAAFFKPKADKFDKVQKELSSASLEQAFETSNHCELKIELPKFKIKTGSQSLLDFYQDRGVKRAFGIDGDAQLGGIGLEPPVKITTLVHSVFFAVDEKGVEAAAATAGVAGGESEKEPNLCDPLKLDEPFMFMIYDTRSKLVLFAGRVMDPSKG